MTLDFQGKLSTTRSVTSWIMVPTKPTIKTMLMACAPPLQQALGLVKTILYAKRPIFVANRPKSVEKTGLN